MLTDAMLTAAVDRIANGQRIAVICDGYSDALHRIATNRVVASYGQGEALHKAVRSINSNDVVMLILLLQLHAGSTGMILS